MRTNSAFGLQKSNSLICRSGEPRYAKARVASSATSSASQLMENVYALADNYRIARTFPSRLNEVLMVTVWSSLI